jgi:hypothetical protein
VMLDHSEKLVRSFVAFGAKPPECMEQIDKARKSPIGYLFDHLKVESRYFLTAKTAKAVALLACDFAEHVFPIWKKYHPNDDRPEKAIHAARGYLVGKIEISTLERARAAASWAAWQEVAASASARAASASERAAEAALRASSRWAANWAAESAWGTSLVAAEAAYYHAEDYGDDPDAAMAAEKKWQIGRTLKVLEAVSRGEDPWRS